MRPGNNATRVAWQRPSKGGSVARSIQAASQIDVPTRETTRFVPDVKLRLSNFFSTGKKTCPQEATTLDQEQPFPLGDWQGLP